MEGLEKYEEKQFSLDTSSILNVLINSVSSRNDLYRTMGTYKDMEPIIKEGKDKYVLFCKIKNETLGGDNFQVYFYILEGYENIIEDDSTWRDIKYNFEKVSKDTSIGKIAYYLY